MSDETRRAGLRLAASTWILTVGIVIGSAILGGSFWAARHGSRTVQVVGLATRPFEADQVKWSLSVSRSVPQSAMREGYGRLAADVRRLVEGIAAGGIPRDSVTLQPVTTQPTYGPQGIQGYQVSQSLFLLSDDLAAVEDLALDPAGLLGEGVVLQNSRLEYFYSGLADVKRELLAAAMEDARHRAEEIAGAAGAEIRKVSTARAGVFQITEPSSTEVAAYGVYNTASRKKEIRVTVHAVFELD